MACVSPPPLDEGALLRYLDGEASAQMLAHLEQCPHCRARAEELGRWQGRLGAGLHRAACPDPATLGDYCLGLLPDGQEAQAQHVRACPRCRAEASQLMVYLAELAPELEISPLERAKTWVARLVEAARGFRQPGAPALAPAYAGVRGAEAGPLVYEAGGVQIALEVQSDAGQPDRKMVLGLITGAGAGQWQAHLWEGDRAVGLAGVDELGNFVLTGLVPGSYELFLSGPGTEIHIQELPVAAT